MGRSVKSLRAANKTYLSIKLLFFPSSSLASLILSSCLHLKCSCKHGVRELLDYRCTQCNLTVCLQPAYQCIVQYTSRLIDYTSRLLAYTSRLFSLLVRLIAFFSQNYTSRSKYTSRSNTRLDPFLVKTTRLAQTTRLDHYTSQSFLGKNYTSRSLFGKNYTSRSFFGQNYTSGSQPNSTQ